MSGYHQDQDPGRLPSIFLRGADRASVSCGLWSPRASPTTDGTDPESLGVDGVRQQNMDVMATEKNGAKIQCDQMAAAQTSSQREIGQLKAAYEELRQEKRTTETT